MKDWTAAIPGNVTKVTIRFVVVERLQGHARRETFDTWREAQDELKRRESEHTGSFARVSVIRQVTVTHIDAA